MSSYHFLFKLIVIGDTGSSVSNSGVGKSCVVRQFTEGKMDINHEATIGV